MSEEQPSTSRDGTALRANLIQDMSSAMEVSAEVEESAARKKRKPTRRKRATRMKQASDDLQQEDEDDLYVTDPAAADDRSDVHEEEMSAEMEADAMERTRPAALKRKGKRTRVVTKSMTSVSGSDNAGSDATPADPASAPGGEEGGGELQMSEEMEPSPEQTKGAAGGLRQRRQLRRTVDGYEEVLAQVTPAGTGGSANNDVEFLMSEEMQPSLEKTKRALMAREDRIQEGTLENQPCFHILCRGS